MDNFRFADNVDAEAVIALGLPAGRLILAGAGAALSWCLAELPGPPPLHLGAAALVAVVTAALAWGRAQGVSLARWSWLLIGFVARALGSVPAWTAAEPEGAAAWGDGGSRSPLPRRHSAEVPRASQRG